MKANLIVTALLLLFVGTSLSAQFRINGTVSDQDGNPLPFANVVLRSGSGKTFVAGTLSERDGSWTLTPDRGGSFAVTASLIGYETAVRIINVERDSAMVVNVSLSPVAGQLETVTVKAERPTIEQREDRLVVHVASGPLRNGLDGTEILQRSPSLWLEDDGRLLVRNQTAMVMINGRPLRLSGGDLMAYLRQLRSEDIQRLEIRTNAGAAVDAENGGGVVNIILKRKPKGSAATMEGRYQYGNRFSRVREATLNTRYGSEKWNIYGSVGRLRNDRWSQSFSSIDYLLTDRLLRNEQTALDTFHRTNFRLGSVWLPNARHSLGLEVFGNFSDFNFRQENGILMTNAGELLESGHTEFAGFRDLGAGNYTLNYTWQPDSTQRKLRVFGDYTWQWEDWYNRATTIYRRGVYADNTEQNATRNATRIVNGQADYVQPFSVDTRLETGAKWTRTERDNRLRSEDLSGIAWVNNDRSSDFTYDEDVLAAYASYFHKLDDRNFLRLGWRSEWTRLDKTDRLDGSTIRQRYVNHFPTFYFSHRLTNETTLAISYRRQLRRPPFYWLNDNVRKFNDFRYEIGNPDLGPEFPNRWELAVQRGRQELAFYYVRTTEAINGIYLLEGEVAYYRKFNAGRQEQWGMEYNRSGKLWTNCDLTAIAQLFRRRFVEGENAGLFGITTFKVRLIATLTLGASTKLEVFGNYYSPQADAYFIREPLVEARLMLRQELFDERVQLRLQLRDVFNTLEFANERPFPTFVATNRMKPATRTLEIRLSWQLKSRNAPHQHRTRSANDARGRL